MRNDQLIEALRKLPPDLEVRTFDDGEWRELTGWPKVGWVGESGGGGAEVILLDAEWDGNLDHVRGMG